MGLTTEKTAVLAAKKALRKLGVNETPRKTYTFDGIFDGKVCAPYQNGVGFVKVSDDMPDLYRAEKVVKQEAKSDETYGSSDLYEFSFLEGTAENGELFGAKGSALFADGMQAPFVVVITDTLDSPIPETGLYFLYLGFPLENYILTFASELVIASAITPISDKYLPGVCLPVVEFSFDGDTFTSAPVGWHTTTQECTDALNAIISKEAPAFLAVLPHKQCTFATLFTRFGDYLSVYDSQKHPRYIAHQMWENGKHWLLDLVSGDIDWGEHDKWMMEFKTFDS